MGLIDDNGNYNVVWDIGGDQQPGVNSATGTGGTFTPDAFNQLTTDSSSFSFTIDSGTRNAIQWIAAKDRILIGTSGGEWRLSGHSNKPITPSNKDIKIQTVWGSKDMQPLVLHEAVLFVDFVGKKLREMVWDGIGERYLSPDLLLLAEHITKSGGITTMAYQRNPDSIIWATLANGELISCTYVREQDVVAWARHPLSTSEAVDANSEVEEITYTDYTRYFVGTFFDNPSTYNVVANATTESALDTTWGTNGFWGYGTNTTSTFDIFQLSDGRTLVSFNIFTYETTKRVGIAMVNTDGTLDTTWGDGGFYSLLSADARWNPYHKILQDNDGNFHLFGSNTNGLKSGYSKISSNGEFISTIDGSYTALGHIFDAVWSDSSKTRILAVGSPATIDNGPGFISANVMAIDPSSGLKDTTFTGNLSYLGFAYYGAAPLRNIKLMSDGGYVVMQNDTTTLIKMISTGVNKDTTWGVNGELEIGVISTNATHGKLAQDGDTLYALTENLIDAVQNLTINKIDSTGTVLATKNIVSSKGVYNTIQVINDKLYLGTTGASPANFNIEIWSQDLVYESGFDISGVDNIRMILPDEVAREFTVDKTRVEGVGYANSVCVIPGTTEDEIWITIERIINGSIVQYIERMKVRYWGTDQEDVFFVDSGLTYDSTAATTFTGLDHLEGETVAVLGDGAVFPNQTVSSGSITNAESASVVHIGLPYTYKLKPMRADQNVGGTTKGSIKNIAEAVVSFYKTGNARYSDGTDSHGIDFRTTEAYTTPPALYTGDKLVHPDAGYSAEDPFQIEGSDPLPCTVRAIIPRIEKTGR